jgi:beta-glucosidase-like glycosyl hydrolase
MNALGIVVLALAAALVSGQNDGLQLNICVNAKTQQWLINPDGTHNFITRKSDGFCIDVDEYASADGAKLWTYKCHPEDTDPAHQNQGWRFRTDGIIEEISTGKVMDRANYGTTPGSQVWLWTYTGAYNQKWAYNTTDETIRATDTLLCLDAGGNVPPPSRPCDLDPAKSLPFCNTALSYDQRVKDLLARLTVDEKMGLFVNGAAAISRLNIPAYQWWSEALHGVANSPGVSFGGDLPHATSFPQVITTGASFNRTLFNTIGQTVSTEARAFNNKNRAGLTFWTPNINIFRDPRWGRGQETPGEDPYLTSEYTYNFVRGMQEGEDTKHLKASACCKHYTAYDVEDWGGVDRHHFNAIVTDQDMTDTYMPPFQTCVQKAKGSSLMCSYNSVNGVPSCANGNIMKKLARETWGFQGYITSDCGAVDDVINNHKYTTTPDATCKAVLEAGMDIECGRYFPNSGHLKTALTDGAVTAADIDTALTNQFLVQYRLGMFDPAAAQPYLTYGPSVVNTPAAQQLALEAARQGTVLLKNANGALPLSTASAKTVAVIGPNSAATTVLLGNYYGNPPYITSVLDGISKYATASHVQGCDIKCAATDFAAAAAAAAAADATVLVVGLDNSLESEGRDRTTIALPGNQAQLISQVAAAAKGPVAVVLMTGGGVDVSLAKADPNVDAILWVGYPGQAGGQAVADVLFGAYNPGGRLPYTIYPAAYTSLSLLDMNMRPNPATGNPGRTYRFYTGSPVYPFGAGLSYTTFQYSNSGKAASLSVSAKSVLAGLELAASLRSYLRQDSPTVAAAVITVKNTGNRAGSDAVLAYVSPPNPGQNGAPLKYLVGFERVSLAAGESVTLTFPVSAMDLSLVDPAGARVPAVGHWLLQAADVSVPITVY